MDSVSQLLSELWAWEFTYFVSHGLALAVGILLTPSFFLRWIGQKPLFHPNLVTIYRVPLYWLGIGIYQFYHPFIGFLIAVGALTLDRLDGKIAKLTDLLTEKGKWLDPLMDKFCVPPALMVMGFSGVIWWGTPLMITLVDIVGTITRDPFLSWIDEKLEPHRERHAWIPRLSDWVRSSEATGIGKLKLSYQFTTVLCCMPYDQGWFDEGQWLLELLCATALILGVLSVASRLHFGGRLAWLNGLVDLVTIMFQHNKD